MVMMQLPKVVDGACGYRISQKKKTDFCTSSRMTGGVQSRSQRGHPDQRRRPTCRCHTHVGARIHNGGILGVFREGFRLLVMLAVRRSYAICCPASPVVTAGSST
jgi:hypothetical protein